MSRPQQMSTPAFLSEAPAYSKNSKTAFPPGAEIIKSRDGGNYAGGYPKGYAEQINFPQKTNYVVTLFIRGVW